MSDQQHDTSPSRRRILTTGGAAAGGLLAAGALGAGTAAAAPASRANPSASAGSIEKIVEGIERILQADGTVNNGVLEVNINRSDLVVRGPGGIRLLEGFQLQHEFYFQAVGSTAAMLNGDLALTAAETQPVIEALIANGLVFQAFHQHLYNLEPDIWFVHFRGHGDPLHLARAAAAVVAKTGAPLPQTSPRNPTTPLPADRLGSILGGDATIDESGVVTVTVPRTDRVTLGGYPIHPELGISTNIQFQPHGTGQAAVVPDFSMTAGEIQPVIATMRGLGWEIGCLYNQETDEHPQLFFSHMAKLGNPISLAREIRRGLDHTAAARP